MPMVLDAQKKHKGEEVRVRGEGRMLWELGELVPEVRGVCTGQAGGLWTHTPDSLAVRGPAVLLVGKLGLSGCGLETAGWDWSRAALVAVRTSEEENCSEDGESQRPSTQTDGRFLCRRAHGGARERAGCVGRILVAWYSASSLQAWLRPFLPPMGPPHLMLPRLPPPLLAAHSTSLWHLLPLGRSSLVPWGETAEVLPVEAAPPRVAQGAAGTTACVLGRPVPGSETAGVPGAVSQWADCERPEHLHLRGTEGVGRRQGQERPRLPLLLTRCTTVGVTRPLCVWGALTGTKTVPLPFGSLVAASPTVCSGVAKGMAASTASLNSAPVCLSLE